MKILDSENIIDLAFEAIKKSATDFIPESKDLLELKKW